MAHEPDLACGRLKHPRRVYERGAKQPGPKGEQDNGTLHGVIVQFGGQTPLKLANALESEGIPILGTTPDAIDLAEDRERFQALVNQLGLKQPKNGIASTDAQALAIAEEIGFPLVIRPSYVLGGRAMEIVRDMAHLASPSTMRAPRRTWSRRSGSPTASS